MTNIQTVPAFAYPIGLDVLAPPQELFDNGIDGEETDDVFRDLDPNDMSEKAKKNAKKRAAKRAKQNDKSKQKRLSAKHKFEKALSERTMQTILPLDHSVCVALGYKDLRPGIISNMNGSQVSALALSQFKSQEFRLPGAETLLLLNLLDKTLTRLLSNKQSVPFKSSKTGSTLHDDSNPYGEDDTVALMKDSDMLLATCDASQRECFATLSLFLEGRVFCSINEHLIALASYRTANGDILVDGTEERVFQAANLLFSCITTILQSNKLTRNSTGASHTLDHFIFELTS